jgi:hypothetical protein
MGDKKEVLPIFTEKKINLFALPRIWFADWVDGKGRIDQ